MKARNKLQRRYSDVKKQEGNCEPQTSSLKCKRQCTPDFFRDSKKSSKVWLIQFKILKHGEKRGLFFCRETQRKNVRPTFFEVKSQHQRYTSCIYRLKCLKKGVADKFIKMPKEQYI